MKKNKRFVFIVTCLMITISCSGLFGTMNMDRQLKLFVNENNLTHEDIQQIIYELDHMEGIGYNKKIKKSLKKIGRLKEKKQQEDRFSVTIEKDADNELRYFSESETELLKKGKYELLAVKSIKLKENILKLRE